MIQYEANGEVHDPHLRASCAQCRNDILGALDNLRIPSHLSRVELVASFVTTFRIILEDTPPAPEPDSSRTYDDDYELDALDALCGRLGERQAIHRASDVHCQAGVSEVVTRLVLQDDPTGQLRGTPGIYASNCPECHFLGRSQLRSSGVEQTVCFRRPVTLLPYLPILKIPGKNLEANAMQRDLMRQVKGLSSHQSLGVLNVDSR